jgi:hypothetical protein
MEPGVGREMSTYVSVGLFQNTPAEEGGEEGEAEADAPPVDTRKGMEPYRDMGLSSSYSNTSRL